MRFLQGNTDYHLNIFNRDRGDFETFSQPFLKLYPSFEHKNSNQTNFMMQQKTRRLIMALAIGSIFSLFSSCTVDDLKPPKWDIALLGPMANATVSVADFADFVSFQESFSDNLTASELGIVTGTFPCALEVDLPDVTNQNFSYSSEFESATFGSGSNLTFSISNTLPVALKAGFTVEVTSGGAALFSHTISESIEPGATYTPSSAIDLSGKVLTTSINYSILNFGTAAGGGSCVPGADEDLTINATDGMAFNFNINGNVSSVIVAPNYQSEEITTSSEVNLSGDEISTTEMEGTFKIKYNNRFKVDIHVKANIDTYTMFDGVIPANSTGVLTSNFLDKATYKQIQSANNITTAFRMANDSNVPQAIVLTDEVDIQFIADLLITINSDKK